MSFRLKEAVFKVRCREPGCPFLSEFTIKENLMGVTEADIDSEALKIAKNLGFIKHDAIYGRKHQLVNPEIFKVGSSYERIGGLTATTFSPHRAEESGGGARRFERGDVIVRKREQEAVACEVIRGSAYNDGHPELRYKAGAVFASAAVFNQKARLADVVAAEPGTEISFHDVKELMKSNPPKARELYDRALEDVFRMLSHFADSAASLQKKAQKAAARKPVARASARPPARTRPAARSKKAPRRAAAARGKPARGRKR